MIRPILEYGHLLYDNCSSSSAQLIEKIQRQSALACTGAYRHTSHSALLTELNWEPLATRRQHFKLFTYYKIYHHIYPPYLHAILPEPPPTHYHLRHTQALRPPKTRLTSTLNSYFPSTTRAWNLLPESTRNAPTFIIFKKLVRGPNTPNHYHRLCTKKYGICLSRIRMGLSGLNQHRHKYNFIPSPTCPSCKEESETTAHFFLTCPTYAIARQAFFNHINITLGINTANTPDLLNTILEGHRLHPRHFAEMISAVTAYISATGRF